VCEKQLQRKQRKQKKQSLGTGSSPNPEGTELGDREFPKPRGNRAWGPGVPQTKRKQSPGHPKTLKLQNPKTLKLKKAFTDFGSEISCLFAQKDDLK